MLGQIGAPSGAGTHLAVTLPLSTLGLSNTTGANGVKGGWRALAAGSNLPNDVYGFWVIYGGNAAPSRTVVFDIGLDPAGGQNYTNIPLQNISGGIQGAGYSVGTPVFFPYFIPAGTGVGVRGASSTSSNTTIFVTARFFFGQAAPHLLRTAGYMELVPNVTDGSGGNMDTGIPAAINTKGDWVEIGTTQKALWYANFIFQRTDAVNGPIANILLDVAYGDATSKTLILQDRIYTSAAAAVQAVQVDWMDGYCDIPAGSKIYARYSTTALTGTYTGFNLVLVGFGG